MSEEDGDSTISGTIELMVSDNNNVSDGVYAQDNGISELSAEIKLEKLCEI